jgi:hypothetical protein
MPPLFLGGLLLYAFLAYCFYRILLRVGYTPYAALLVFVPIVGQAILIAWLAFGRWPLLDHAEAYREWYEHVTEEDVS